MADEKQNKSGVLEWKVTGELLRQFKNAKHSKQRERFSSPQFKTTYGTVWRIDFEPRTTPCYSSIYLKCVELNPQKERIGINYSLTIMELGWSFDYGHAFEDGEYNGEKKAFKAERLHGVNALTILCFVEETMDLTDGNTYFEWKLNNHLLQKCKNAKFKKNFFSPNFNAIGEQWYLTLNPNGYYIKGVADLDITCMTEAKVEFCYYVDVDVFNHSEIDWDGDHIEEDEGLPFDSPFKLHDIRNLSEIIIGVKVWKIGSIIRRKTTNFISNIRLEKIVKLRKELKEAQHLQTASHATTGTVTNLKKRITSLEARCTKKEEENTALRKETDLLQIEIAKLKSLAMKEITTLDYAHDAVIETEVKDKQKEFDLNLEIDQKRLREWNVDSTSIQNELKSEEKEDVSETMTQLLNRYMECKTRCDKQQIRMENVVTYCSKLNKMKKLLKQESSRCDEMVNKMEKEHQELNGKYKTLQANRKKLQAQWMNVLQEMNKTIDEENATNAAKYGAENQYFASHLEAKQWNLLHTKCVQLLKQYRSFDTENEQNIHNMKDSFGILWDKSMKHWFKWQAEDIICWLKYLRIQNELTLSNEFNFDHVLNEMVKSKMNGLSLINIDKSDLKTIGVMTLNDRQQIYHKINTLMAKYPHQHPSASETVEGQCEVSNIPNEFVCPLTKKLMREPVKIFDDQTYEKGAIETYLKEFNKSPITGEECDGEDDHWTLPNRKLKEKIEIFLAANTNSINQTRKRRLEEQKDDHVHEPPKKKLKHENN